MEETPTGRVPGLGTKRCRAGARAIAVAGLALFAGPVTAGLPDARPVAPPAEPYRIGAGDRLQLFVWREAELTRELTVRIDGFITVPLIGDVPAAGLTPEQVSSAVQRKLSQYVNNPNVTVGVVAAQSAQFFVVGRVARPGAYPLERSTSFLQALALAGGFLDFAKTDRVLVFRGDGKVISVNYKKLEGGEGSSDNIPILSGDTVVVP
jgi:polysaccharide export outer membrane protein